MNYKIHLKYTMNWWTLLLNLQTMDWYTVILMNLI